MGMDQMNDMSDWLNGFHELNPDTIERDDELEKKSYKLDLFSQILPAIDRRDKLYYRKLKPEEQASIEPWILMRWIVSPASDKEQIHYLLSVNDFVNNNFNCLAPKKTLGIKGHKELQWMLLAMCGTGKKVHRKFLKPGKGTVKNKLEEAVLSFFPLLKDSDLELLLKINSQEELKNFFIDNGYDDKSLIDLFKK
jgi:hypothetical protein